MRLHPIHPMLVHAPVACWLLVPASDIAAVVLVNDFFWRVSALLSAIGVLGGVLAASAGALDFERAHKAAPKIAIAHASLMSIAFTLSIASLLGRVAPNYDALTPPPSWAMFVSGVALVSMLAGAWCGGELVYGRGVGVDRA